MNFDSPGAVENIHNPIVESLEVFVSLSDIAMPVSEPNIAWCMFTRISVSGLDLSFTSPGFMKQRKPQWHAAYQAACRT